MHRLALGYIDQTADDAQRLAFVAALKQGAALHPLLAVHILDAEFERTTGVFTQYETSQIAVERRGVFGMHTRERCIVGHGPVDERFAAGLELQCPCREFERDDMNLPGLHRHREAQAARFDGRLRFVLRIAT